MEAEMSMSTLEYLFHHVFLPPKLPNEDDRSAQQDDLLLGFAQDCLAQFSSMVGEQHKLAFEELCAMIQGMRQVRNPLGHLDERVLLEALQRLSFSGITS
jgi:hypothetical protein